MRLVPITIWAPNMSRRYGTRASFLQMEKRGRPPLLLLFRFRLAGLPVAWFMPGDLLDPLTFASLRAYPRSLPPRLEVSPYALCPLHG